MVEKFQRTKNNQMMAKVKTAATSSAGDELVCFCEK